MTNTDQIHRIGWSLGAFAALKLGLKIGDEFKPYHGLNYASKPSDMSQALNFSALLVLY